MLVVAWPRTWLACCTVVTLAFICLSALAGSLPSFDEPSKGFVTRGDDLMGRLIADRIHLPAAVQCGELSPIAGIPT